MAVEEYAWIEKDFESGFIFFYCRACPLSFPFLTERIALAYYQGHQQNNYHKRRLELLG